MAYTINNIDSINKLTTDKIDGVKVGDLCFLDAACSVTCAEGVSPCATFSQTVTVKAPGVVALDQLEGVDVDTVNTKLATNNNAYTLASLEVTNGLDWTTDNVASPSVTHLYSNLVIKSGKQWSSKTQLPSPPAQSISGATTLSGTVSFANIVLDSGKVTVKEVDAGTGAETETDFHPVNINTDGARKNTANTFTAHKTFQNIKAANVHVDQLKDATVINDVTLATYRSNALVTAQETGSEELEQTITGTYSLDNGIIVTGEMNVKENIAGCVKVEDLVQEDVYHDTKIIPKVNNCHVHATDQCP